MAPPLSSPESDRRPGARRCYDGHQGDRPRTQASEVSRSLGFETPHGLGPSARECQSHRAEVLGIVAAPKKMLRAVIPAGRSRVEGTPKTSPPENAESRSHPDARGNHSSWPGSPLPGGVEEGLGWPWS